MTFLARKGGVREIVLAVEAVHLWHCFRSRLVSHWFPRGGWVCVILWSPVCPRTCFKPTRFHGEISARFGPIIHEIYKRRILTSQ